MCHLSSESILATILGVYRDGGQVSVLTDGRLATCITLSEVSCRMQAVVTFVLKKPYNESVDVVIHGRGMQCELQTTKCMRGFSTAVFQQGRISHPCEDQPSPCPGAEICTPLGMTSQGDGMVSCRYRCSCPLPVNDEDTSCQTMLLSISSGARSEIGQNIQLCSVNVDWNRWCSLW